MKDPLLPPAGDTHVLGQFLEHFRIRRTGNPQADLEQVARAFSRLPYENLTKILRYSEAGGPSFRTPDVVVREHRQFGAGGTCFSLAAAFVYLVRCLGMRAEPILADRKYGTDTHAAVLVWIEDRAHLVDPGYLITTPIPLEDGPLPIIETPFHEVILANRDDGKLELSTASSDKVVYRLTYRTEPADSAAFLRAWSASFDWDMMHYPLLTRVVGDAQVYLQSQRIQVRTKTGVQVKRISIEELSRQIASSFGMTESIVQRALAVLEAGGDIIDG